MKTISEHITSILAIIIVVAGIAFIFLTTFIPPKNQDSQGLIAMINFMSLVLGYYWGTLRNRQKAATTIKPKQ